MQAGFFVLVAIIVTTSGLKEAGFDVPLLNGASPHAVCPFGVVVSFWQLASAGTLVKKVHQSSVALGVIGILLAILFGPVICGWVCPFGTFQDWLGKLGRKLFGRRCNTFAPARLDRVLRCLRYFVLIWMSYMTIVTGKLAFEAVDPYFALFNFWRSEASIGEFIVQGITVILSLFIVRPFCKYACPYAVDSASTVRDHQCISCLTCTSEAACTVPSMVELAVGAFPAVEGVPGASRKTAKAAAAFGKEASK